MPFAAQQDFIGRITAGKAANRTRDPKGRPRRRLGQHLSVRRDDSGEILGQHRNAGSIRR